MEPVDLPQMTLAQNLRDRWMEVLLTRPNVGKVQDAMLMATPIVNYIISGHILGIDGVVSCDAPPAVARSAKRSASV